MSPNLARVWWCLPASLLVALVVLTAFGGQPAGRRVPAQRHVVEIRGMAFHPAVLEVAPGDTVVWINRDMVPHTATADGSSGWDTGVLAQQDSGQYVPRRIGETPYVCTLHPTMQGRVIVTERPRAQ